MKIKSPGTETQSLVTQRGPLSEQGKEWPKGQVNEAEPCNTKAVGTSQISAGALPVCLAPLMTKTHKQKNFFSMLMKISLFLLVFTINKITLVKEKNHKHTK